MVVLVLCGCTRGRLVSQNKNNIWDHLSAQFLFFFPPLRPSSPVLAPRQVAEAEMSAATEAKMSAWQYAATPPPTTLASSWSSPLRSTPAPAPHSRRVRHEGRREEEKEETGPTATSPLPADPHSPMGGSGAQHGSAGGPLARDKLPAAPRRLEHFATPARPFTLPSTPAASHQLRLATRGASPKAQRRRV